MKEHIRVSQMVYNLDVEKGGGGITRFAIHLSLALDPSKFQVTLVSLGKTTSPVESLRVEELSTKGIKVLSLSPWQDNKPYRSFIKATQNLNDFLKQSPQHILHSHSEFTDISALFAKVSGKVPRICRTIHYGYDVEWRKRPLRRLLLTNFLFPLLFDQEVGINQTITTRLDQRTIARLLRRSAIKIYNAIDLQRFSVPTQNNQALKKKLGIPEGMYIVGSIGRLAEQKGYRYLLEAIPPILSGNPNIQFIIIGDGELRDSLEQQARSLNICSNVTFTGPRTDISDLLSIIDLFVSPSLWEGLPTVILESMASETPVIATDIPGSRDLIVNNHSGLLVPPANPNALSQAILHAIGSPILMEQWVKNAREIVQKFSIENIARNYESLYEDLVNR